ncbi:GrpB family protein [bacterium]|nr:GrpB family protein [bacterium]
MSTKVELLGHNPDWVVQAAQEAQRFTTALGGDSRLLRIHHIGSTSIAGIRAKGIIDLMPEVTSVEWLDEMQAELVAAGYEFWGEYGLEGRRFCPRNGQDGWRCANLHCYASGHPGIARHLAFRDYLRAFPEKARDYERMKDACAATNPQDAQAYTDCKAVWITPVLEAALEWWRAPAQSLLRAPQP